MVRVTRLKLLFFKKGDRDINIMIFFTVRTFNFDYHFYLLHKNYIMCSINLINSEKLVFCGDCQETTENLIQLSGYPVIEITAFVFSPEIFNRSQHWYLTRPDDLYHPREKFKFRSLCFECSDPIKEPSVKFYWICFLDSEFVPLSVLDCYILFLCCSHFHCLVPPFDLLQYIYSTRKYISVANCNG